MTDPTPAADDDGTGLPMLKSWRAVYILVAILFAAYLIGLTLLSGQSW